MTSDSLRASFEGHLDEFERFQGYVDRARALSGKFRDEVVTKVVAEYNAAKLEVVAAIMVAQADVEGALATLAGRKGAMEASASASRLGLEELELRLAIGDLDQRAFNKESATFQAEIARVDRELGELSAEMKALEATLKRWERVGVAAGVLKAA